jgi:TatD DNase family protein
MLIDTHAHVHFKYFKDDADEVIQRSLEANTWVINVGADQKTSKRALDYANRYEQGVFASVGLHPMHLFSYRATSDEYDFQTRGESFSREVYEKLAKFEKVVAIGEIGLDYYHMDIGHEAEVIKEVQKNAFLSQLELARDTRKPAIIHCREAHDDMLALLTKFRKENSHELPRNRPWGVIHSYRRNEDLLLKYINLGLIVSFNGIITFSKKSDDMIRKIPLSKFMLETDSPFLTPEPHRGKRNEPKNVKYVARHIAKIKGLSEESISCATTETARNFFQI